MVNPEVKDVTSDIQNEGITTEDEKERRIAIKSKKIKKNTKATNGYSPRSNR